MDLMLQACIWVVDMEDLGRGKNLTNMVTLGLREDLELGMEEMERVRLKGEEQQMVKQILEEDLRKLVLHQVPEAKDTEMVLQF